MKVKKILLTLGISIIGLIGYTHGVTVEDYGYIGNWRDSNINNSYSNNLLTNGSFLGQYFGQTFDSYLGGPNNYVFWTKNENYPIYMSVSSTYGVGQGYITQYGLCSSFFNNNGDIDYYYNPKYSCDFYDINSGFKNDYIVNRFFTTLTVGDTWIFLPGSSDRYPAFGAFCINNSGLNQTICLGNYCDGAGCTPHSFTNSEGFSDFFIIDRDLIGISPFAGGNNNTGNTSNKFCPPIRFQIDMYGSRFNTGLCYSNTQIISGNQIIEETPITMLEAFPTYQDYNNARNLFTDYCHTDYQNTTEECQTALQSIGRKKAQIVWKAIKNNQDNTILKRERIYQYCYLNLTYTGDNLRNIGRCDLTDEQKYAPGLDSSGSPNPLDGYEDMLLNSETEIELPPDGTVFDEILPDGIISWKNLFTNFDFFKSIGELIGKIFILFKVRPTVEGILPPVIMSLLLLIILFRIFKK